MEKVSFDGIEDPFPGVTRYLLAGPEVRKTLNRSKYNKSARGAATWALWFLILFCHRQDEDEVARVLHPRSVAPLTEVLIGNGCPQISPRHYQIAKGYAFNAKKRLKRLVDEKYSAVVNRLLDQAVAQMMQLEMSTGEGPEAAKVLEQQRQNPDYEEERRETERDLQNLAGHHGHSKEVES